ncbi:MAG: sulfotransferase [Bacteroidetes bacterium]|nr:sulfotransferase [Bacteroidota bacterium]
MDGISKPEVLRRIPMFFIVGMGRSGTTLLKSIMDNHPELICPPESKFILFLRRKYRHKLLEKKDVEQIIKYVSDDRKVQAFWNLDFELLKKNLEACVDKGGNYNDICKLIYLHDPSALPKKNIKFIGDKNPGYTMYIDWFNENFEGSKFIHVIRDYRDCIASYNRVFKKSFVGILAKTWMAYTEKVEKMKRLFPDRFITVRYEDLTNNPDQEIAKICEFLKVQPAQSMLGYSEKIREQSEKFNSDDFNNIHGELLKPIHNKNIGKYKKYLTEKQVEIIEFICGKKGKEYHYEPTLQQKGNFIFPFIQFYSSLICRIEISVIRFYYWTPYFLRVFFRKSSNFLFSVFRYSNKFNHAELMSKKKPIKKSIG